MMAKLGRSSVAIFVLVLNIGFSLGQNRLYSGQNCTGLFLEIPSGKEHPSLSEYGFDNVTKSVKVDGRWLFYDLPSFNEENITAPYEYVATASSSTCYNLTSTSGIVSSVREIGDYYNGWESLDLFTMHTYAGPKEATIDTHNSVSSLVYNEHVSAVLMGDTSWTIYSRDNETGPAYCLFPDEGSEVTWINDFQQLDPPIPYAFIQSVDPRCNAVDAIHVRVPSKQ